MNRYLMKFLSRAVFMAPLGDDQGVTAGAGGAAAAVDRGDTLSAGAPVVDDQAAKDAAAEAERIRAEEAAKAGAKEGEGEGEGEGEAAGADGKKPAMIPVERHKTMLDKLRAERDALAAQVAATQQGKVVAATNETITKIEERVIAKEAEYNKLLVEGEVEKATAVMREIRKMEGEMVDLKADLKAQASTAQAVESIRYDTAVERLEAAYPVLNPDHESFDKDQVSDIMDLKETYQRKGLGATAALQKAVAKLLGAATGKQETATTVTPRVDAAAVAAAERKEAATAKAVDAATKTPPSAAKVGADSDKHGGGAVTAEDVMKMGQDKFATLNEETLARLRGDIV